MTVAPVTVPTVTVACPHCREDGHRVVGQTPDLEMGTCVNEFRFAECTACGWVYLRDRPAPSALDTIYPHSYAPHDYDAYLGAFTRWLRHRVLTGKANWLARLAPASATVVDVGCGNGDLLRGLREVGPAQWKLLGIDISQAAVEALRSSGIEGHAGRFEEMAWRGPADLVLLLQTIEHVDDPMATLKKAWEVLEPGGALVVETPSLDGWDAAWFRRRHWGGWHAPRHWTLFDRRTLAEAFTDAGFEIVSSKYLLSPNTWILSLHNWLIERPRARRLARFCEWKFPPALAAACAADVLQLLARGRTSNLRMVGRKPGAART